VHRPAPKALLTALERLATAEGVLEMLNAAGDWVELGLLDAMALWIRDPSQDVLHLAHLRGVPASLKSWRAGPRGAGGPLWSVIDRAESMPVDPAALPLGLAVPLKASEASHFTIHPLRDRDGVAFAVVIAGVDLREDPNRSTEELPWSTLGAALHRSCVADKHRWRAAWFDALLPLVDDGIIVAGPDGELYSYSPALERLLGWTEAQVRDEGWLTLVYPDPAEREASSRAIAALMMGEPSRGVVRNLAGIDGRQVQAEVYSTIVPHPSGATPALVGLIRDVTRARLEVRHRARDDALTRLGRMAGGVAHEFNNLLGAIMGHAELVAMSAEANEEHRRRAQMVVAAAQRGGVLSRQLLAFSGATITRIEPVPTRPLLDELVELYRPSMAAHLTILVEATRCSCTVEADPAHLQQALMNLLVNAGEAAHTQIGVSVGRAPLPDATRYSSAEAPSVGTDMCCITVWDDGPGFSAEAITNLFEPFWTGKPQGHGLGLAAVRGIVGNHGGAIAVGPKMDGNGARIDIYLPISTRPELALPHLAATRNAARGTVWLVDDEEALLEFASIALRSSGYDVRTFARGADAVQAVRGLAPGEGPDVLVIDVVMPDMDGPSTVAALRAAGSDAHLLWTSGFSPERAQVPPDGRFLQKPYAGTELGRAIAQLLTSEGAA